MQFSTFPIEHSYDIVGLDTDFYRGNDLYAVKRPYRKVTKDTRDASYDVKDFESVVHL